MKKVFGEIKKINATFYDDIDKQKEILKALAKLSEEYGELVRGINMSIGVKSTKWSKVKIKANITEEAVDLIQNLFSICDLLGISYDEIYKWFPIKNKKWINKKLKSKNVKN